MTHNNNLPSFQIMFITAMTYCAPFAISINQEVRDNPETNKILMHIKRTNK